MAVQLPDSGAIERTLAVLNSDQVPSDGQLRALLKCPVLNTGLDRWQLWTLICLCSHLHRQKWVGYIVETRLKGDLAKLGRAGSLEHPDDLPKEGEVPDEPGWRYYFHGRGCCLTHERDGTSIDVDFTDEGASDRIDRFFFSGFLEDLKRPEFPESELQRKAPLQHAWQANITGLVSEGCIEVNRGLHVPQIGRDLIERIEPVVAQISELAKATSPPTRRRLVYAALSLGDVLLAERLASSAELGEALANEIMHVAEKAKERRAAELTERLRTSSSGTDTCQLAALAELGVGYAKPLVTESLFRTPVDGIANQALAILVSWNEPDLWGQLESLFDLRYSQSFGSRSIARPAVSNGVENDRQPREYQLVHAAMALLQRSPAESLRPRLREEVVSLLEAADRANSGQAGLLLYAVNREKGVNRLRAALSGKVPAAHTDAAAACVLLGTPEAKQILVEALDNPNLQIQHTAACALKRFPTPEARELAARWSARFDGIDSPLGQEVSIAGKTITTYPMDDVMHANADIFFSASLDRMRKEFGVILATGS